MSRYIDIILKREYAYYFQSVSDVRIIERLRLSNVIIKSKRFTEYCFYKLNSNLSFQFKSKLERVKDTESRCCWCLILLNDTRIIAKIMHIGRGKFKILNDKYDGKYVNETVDASDILSCDLDVKSNYDHN
ncbi:MAG TPA: hypothetical protein VH500_15905 [Nitrososphaeraceae archaeon]|jgi:hypothetical protein